MADISYPPGASQLGTYTTLFKLTAANLNSVLDQALLKAFDFTVYLIKEIVVTNASGVVSNAKGGVYSGANKTGAAIVSANQSYAGLKTVVDAINPAITPAGAGLMTALPILSLTTPEGAPVTADISIMGMAG